MDLAAVREIGKATLAEVKDDDVSLLASAVAFRIFLSIFPTLIAAVAIFGLVTEPSELSRLLNEARAVVPGDAFTLLQRTLAGLTETGAGGIAVAGIAGGLWAASSAAAVLIKALNLAYDVHEGRKFAKLRGVALAITLALFVAIATLMVLLVLGRFLQGWLVPESMRDQGLEFVIVAARIVASLVVLMILFAVIYWIGPNRDVPSFKWITPGSVVGVLGWLALSGAFALYTRLFGNYGATYGSLAGAVLMMLWIQLSMVTLLVGAELNQVWERQLRVGDRKGSVIAAD
jgi:membrane protein